MKKRKTLVVSLLLIAALALGIGYAALSDDLFATGTVGINLDHAEDAFQADVYFSKAGFLNTANGTATIGELATGTGDNDKLIIAVAEGALKGAGESVVCAVELANKGDLDALVTITELTNTNEEYFKITTSWADNTATLAHNGTADLSITITCLKTPSTEAVNSTFEITFNAESVTPLS